MVYIKLEFSLFNFKEWELKICHKHAKNLVRKLEVCKQNKSIIQEQNKKVMSNLRKRGERESKWKRKNASGKISETSLCNANSEKIKK